MKTRTRQMRLTLPTVQRYAHVIPGSQLRVVLHDYSINEARDGVRTPRRSHQCAVRLADG
jgi:hypothetical protein